MKLGTWVEERIKEEKAAGRKASAKSVLEGLACSIGELACAKTVSDTVSFVTLQGVAKGARLSKYTKAQAIEKATDGKVTIAELCQ